MAVRIILFYISFFCCVISIGIGSFDMILPERNANAGIMLFLMGCAWFVNAIAWIECRLQVETKEAIKKIATDFFYWWYNRPGTNTSSGFDEWWETKHKRKDG